MNQGQINQYEVLSKTPLVSIITGVYNGEKYLQETIESILNQSYPNLEYIIVDGESTDNTVEIIRRYEARFAFWKSEKDRGLYEAWNKALTAAKGEWICFVGSDDILYPDAIKNYVDFINERQTLGLEYVSAKIELVTNDLKLMRVVGEAWNWNTFKVYMNTAHVGSFHHKSLFQKYGVFDINYKITGDYEFLLRSGKELKAGFMDKVTVKMRTEDTLSMRNASVTQRETLRAKTITAKRNIIFANFEMWVAVLKASIRKLLGI